MIVDHIKKLKRALKYHFDVHVRKDMKVKAYHDFYTTNKEGKLLVSYPLEKDSIVFDVGGYLGYYVAEIYCRYGCRTVVFEPVDEYAKIIRSRFKNNSDIVVVQAGLGGTKKTLTINKSLEASSVFGQKDKPEEIQLLSLIAYMNDQGYEKVDLIKINIEGGEYELLASMLATTELANRFNYVLIQFHDFVSDASRMRASIREKLSITHELMWDFPFIWESWKKKA